MSTFSLFICSQRISNTLHASPNRTFAETRLLTGLAGRGCRGGLQLGSASTRIEPPSLYHMNTHVSPAFLLSVSLHTSLSFQHRLLPFQPPCHCGQPLVNAPSLSLSLSSLSTSILAPYSSPPTSRQLRHHTHTRILSLTPLFCKLPSSPLALHSTPVSFPSPHSVNIAYWYPAGFPQDIAAVFL